MSKVREIYDHKSDSVGGKEETWPVDTRGTEYCAGTIMYLEQYSRSSRRHAGARWEAMAEGGAVPSKSKSE